MDRPKEVKSLWRNQDYLLLWMGQSISSLGTGISQVAFPLLLFVLTNNPVMAGLAVSVGQLPSLLFMLPAGALVDRWDRKRVMIVCTAGLALCLTSVALVVLGRLPTLIQLTSLCVCSFLIGTFSVFYGLAELGALTQVVPQSQLPQALAQNEVVFSMTSLAAPLGTLLLSISRLLPFLTDAISYVVLLVSLFFIRTSFQEERGERKIHLFKDIHEGLLWVWQQPIVRFLLVLDGYLELFVSSNILLVAVIARNERIPLSFVGIILAAAGVGNLLGAACSPMLQRRVPVGWLLIGTLLLFVLLWPLYGVVRNPWVLGSVIASLALLDSVAYLQTVSYRLAVVPDLLQGRVSSIARLVLFGSSTFGPVGVGICLQRFGVLLTTSILWVGFILFALLALFNPRLRQASLPTE